MAGGNAKLGALVFVFGILIVVLLVVALESFGVNLGISNDAIYAIGLVLVFALAVRFARKGF